jgi:hypothetical protein
MNSTSVTEQVNSIKSRPNLLLWYTGDEPDGTSDPLDATTTAYDLITSLDGADGSGGGFTNLIHWHISSEYQLIPLTHSILCAAY